MNGLFLIDKPSGISSFRVVKILTRHLNLKRCGHFGTLDPMATGLLLTAAGSATRLMDYFADQAKTYRAHFTLGYSTDTLDAEGTITECLSSEELAQWQSRAQILVPEFKAAVEKLEQLTLQIVPEYSAAKHQGRTMYSLKRSGQEVPVKKKTINVYCSEFLGTEIDREGKIILEARIQVSSGTYIRSFTENLRTWLGIPATLTGLRREMIGGFDVADAVSLSQIEDSATFPSESFIPLYNLGDHLSCPVTELTEPEINRLNQGKSIVRNSFDSDYLFGRARTSSNTYIGILAKAAETTDAAQTEYRIKRLLLSESG